MSGQVLVDRDLVEAVQELLAEWGHRDDLVDSLTDALRYGDPVPDDAPQVCQHEDTRTTTPDPATGVTETSCEAPGCDWSEVG